MGNGMVDDEFAISPGAKIGVSLLSPTEKARLASLIAAPSQDGVKRTDAGHFVSRLGHDKRVLWEQRGNAPPIILSIVDSSYIPA